jgi:DNA-binding NtrC family response regulator
LEKIIIIDDDEKVGLSIAKSLTKEGYDIALFTNPYQAIELLNKVDVDLILTDKNMPGMSGIKLVELTKDMDNPPPVIVFTGHGDIDSAVEAMRAGANDFICKPLSAKELSIRVGQALEKQRMRVELNGLKKKLEEPDSFHSIVGSCKKMQDVFDLVEAVANTDATVLISGETGTGKEMVARAIHSASNRSKDPFVAVCCTALQHTLLESELFGHEKGAFTGAHAAKLGKMELAGSGTFLLDEVGDTSLDIQSKLLRVLEEKEFERVGGIKPIKLKARLLASTNTDLMKAVEEKKFREDLFYRLNVVQIELPPLREREGATLQLATHFLNLFNKRHNKRIEGFSPSAIEQMHSYNWPGNVRELKNVVERTVLTSTKVWIEKLSKLQSIDSDSKLSNGLLEQVSFDHAKSETQENLEKTYLLHYLKHENGRINKVATLMDVSVRTIHRLMKKYDIDKNEFKDTGTGS